MGISVCLYSYWKDNKAQNIPMLLKRSAKKAKKFKKKRKKFVSVLKILENFSLLVEAYEPVLNTVQLEITP